MDTRPIEGSLKYRYSTYLAFRILNICRAKKIKDDILVGILESVTDLLGDYYHLDNRGKSNKMSRLFEQGNVKKKTCLNRVLFGILGEISTLK